MSGNPGNSYLKRVSAVLDKTGHPRRDEVLEDLHHHLEEMNVASKKAPDLAELIERLGSPEEYAESLAPAEGYRLKSWHRRRSVQALCLMLTVIAVLVAVGSVTIFPDRYAVKAHIRRATSQNFVAPSPFFDLDVAASLKPGIDGQAIRDAIGYPWRRYPGMPELDSRGASPLIHNSSWSFAHLAAADEIVWEYARSPEVHAPFYTVCNVITDREENLLRVETREVEVSYSVRKHVSGYLGYQPNISGSFQRQQKSDLVLNPGNPGLYLIANLRLGAGEPIPAAVSRREQEIRSKWTGVATEQLQLVFQTGPTVIDYELWKKTDSLSAAIKTISRHTFDTMMAELQDSVPVYDSWSLGSYSRAEADAMQVYHRGVLYEFPPLIHTGTELNEADCADQVWLLRRLQEE